MKTRESWWRLFAHTGSIKAYLLYRGVVEPPPCLSVEGEAFDSSAAAWEREEGDGRFFSLFLRPERFPRSRED